MYLVKAKTLQCSTGEYHFFADEDIPKGTIVFVFGEQDIQYSKEEFEKLSPKQQDRLIDFAVEDEFGNWYAPSTNIYPRHSCSPPIMPLFVGGYYTDIAVTDIKRGDEFTVDYSLYFCSTKWQMTCNCGAKKCRKIIGFGLKPNLDLEKFWEKRLNSALQAFSQVPQPIFQSKDKHARKIASILQAHKKPTLGKYTKFCLIDDDSSS